MKASAHCTDTISFWRQKTIQVLVHDFSLFSLHDIPVVLVTKNTPLSVTWLLLPVFYDPVHVLRKGGSTGDDNLEAIVACPDRTAALAGYTDGEWPSESSAGSNDFVVVMLDTDSPATPAPSGQLRQDQANSPAISMMAVAVICTIAAVCALFGAGSWVRRRKRASFTKASSTSHPTEDGDVEHDPIADPDGDESNPTSGPSRDERGQNSWRALSSSRRTASSSDLGVVEAMVDAAKELAKACPFPGISEAATLMLIVVRLFEDGRDNAAHHAKWLKRCSAIIVMLQSAAEVLGKGMDYSTTPELFLCVFVKRSQHRHCLPLVRSVACTTKTASRPRILVFVPQPQLHRSRFAA